MRDQENEHGPEAHAATVAARLGRLADVRASVVARGKTLVANPNYPDKKTMRAAARVLAQHWRGK